MKKHLLMIILLSLLSISAVVAQTFEFRYHGESLADGATVTIVAEENDFGEIACETNPSSNPNNGLVLQLLSGNYTQCAATMTIIDKSFICKTINWCMGGSCSSMESNSSLTRMFTFTNGICQVQFEALDIESDGYLLASLAVTIDGVTRMVIIKFINGEQVADTDFEFRYRGASLADDATVTIAAEENYFGEMACETNPSSSPDNGLVLQTLSGNYTQGAAILTIKENTLIYDKLIWCMGETCTPFGNNTSLFKTFPIENCIARVLFECQDIMSDGHLLATLTAFVGGVSHSVDIKFTNGEQDEPIPGDVNADGDVTAADVTALYSYLLNDDDSDVVNGDQDGDGNITAGDITTVYSILLGN